MLAPYEVLHAELIWCGMSRSSGSFGGNNVIVDISSVINNPIILTDPNGNTVQITPSTATFSLGAVSNNNIFYTRSQYITTIVQNGGPGSYTVGRVPSAINIYKDNEINHAGWSMIVAYKNTNLTPKNMSIYAGGNLITPNGTVNVPISGFLTPPSGPIEARLSLSA